MYLVVGVIIKFLLGIDFKDDYIGITLIICYIPCYILVVRFYYNKRKKASICPRCKMTWAWCEKITNTETLSEGYISEDVKIRDGLDRYRFSTKPLTAGTLLGLNLCLECLLVLKILSKS